MTTAKPTAVSPGTAITARPWCGGELIRRPCWGIVLGSWGCDNRDVLAWFPTRGGPDQPGRAVQAILAHEIETTSPLTARPRGWVRVTYRALRRTGVLTDTPEALRLAYDTALRYHAR